MAGHPISRIGRHQFLRRAQETVTITDDGNPQTDKVRYLHRDHIGSLVAITDETGAIAEQLAYDPHGKRREADWKADLTGTLTALETPRGFTGHEHLDTVGLIHMNGRVYDPTLGRFLSADPFIAYPETTQGFNRYSYIDNNPLSYTDPSGFDYEEDPGSYRNDFDPYGDYGTDPNGGIRTPSDNPGSVTVRGDNLSAREIYSIRGNTTSSTGSFWNGVLGVLTEWQIGIDVGASAPFIGIPLDILSATISALNGDWVGVGAGIIGIAPGIGDTLAAGIKGAKYASKIESGLGVIPIRPGPNTFKKKPGNVATIELPSSPDFVVTPAGTAFPVPKGATGPTPVVNPAGKTTGSAFTGGKGGANKQVDTMRMMDPTSPKGKDPGHPRGYIKYENKSGQGVDPYTGRTIPDIDSHFPID